MKVGVIGIGNVGYPLYEALKYYHDNNVFCWDLEKKCDEWGHILSTYVTFICVPTNQGEDGRLNMKHIESVLEKLDKTKYKGLAVIKSTLRLGYINEAIERYGKLNIAVFPEWLREVSAFPDTLTPEMTVIGEKNKSLEVVQKIIDACKWHKMKDVIIVKPEEAVLIKLTANALASTKISFANQIQLICEKYNIDEKEVMGTIRKDPRCAPRYLLPGKPFAGNCLPKDLMELERSIDDGNALLKSVREINDIYKKRNETNE